MPLLLFFRNVWCIIDTPFHPRICPRVPMITTTTKTTTTTIRNYGENYKYNYNSSYSCYCIDGYTGIQCQTNWDECWSGPCQNGGTCVDGVAYYNCTCPEGFSGKCAPAPAIYTWVWVWVWVWGVGVEVGVQVTECGLFLGQKHSTEMHKTKPFHRTNSERIENYYYY